MTRKVKIPPRPPWLDDHRPDLWVSAGKFALLMNRTRETVHAWYRNGTLKEFGYAHYRDLTGKLFIRIQETDAPALRQICQKRPIYKDRATA